jgi:cyclopropane-fatty-acyl-phospholipid synthase
MRSRLYNAFVSHERHAPAEHDFRYRVPVFVFDLGELETGALDGPLFGRRLAAGSRAVPGPALPRLLSFREGDHLYSGRGGVRDKLGWALEAGGLDPELALGPVRLVTSARFLGYAFNPVSFWFVLTHDQADGPVAAVAEVNNTFGEKHLYVLGDGLTTPFPARFQTPKAFHVSPFNDMQGEYRFDLADPRQGLDLSVELLKQDRPLLTARLWSEEPGREVTASTLAGFLLHPQRMLTYPRILKEAFKLYYRRRLPVHTKPSPSSPMTIRQAAQRPGPLTLLSRKVLTLLLGRIRSGRIRLVLPDGRSQVYHGAEPGPSVELKVLDQRFFPALARSGDIGFGEAYSAGWWTTRDLPELLRFFVLNREPMRMSKALKIPGPVVSLFNGLRRLGGQRNTRPGARKNIQAHYDLGDDMFETFLDSSMAYSCAWFERPDMSLAEAQEAKFRKAAEKLDLSPEDRVLEIGFGWGGFALYAAERYGCRVDGITLSENQLAAARDRARRAGLDDRVSFSLMDYRDISQTYDKIVSIEMLEAVGHAYHRDFFTALERLLAPGGLVFLQFIAIHDQRYDAYRFQGDWTRKHIFPGGLLPSLTRVMEVVRDCTRFTARDLESLAEHYVRTLALWRERFLAQEAKLEELGYGEAFRRTWSYYLAYCQAGFSCRVIDDYQLVLARPQGSRPLAQAGGHTV